MRVASFAMASLVLASCHGFVSDDVGRAIGATCRNDDDCQASACVEGFCTVACQSSGDCPFPSTCTAAGRCEILLNGGFVYAGDPSMEQWAFGHELGRQTVQGLLSYLTSDFRSNAELPSDAVTAVDDLIAGGAEVIIVNSPTAGANLTARADANPGVQFLIHGSRLDAPNLARYETRLYQAYFVAGKAAATKSASGRIGIVGSYPSPPVVAAMNAFHLGARSVDPTVVTDVRWIGFWHAVDPPINGESLEFLAARDLVDAGADVVAHTMDNGSVVASVATYDGNPEAVAIGANLATACQGFEARCIGVAYPNWAPFYRRLLGRIREGNLPGQDPQREGFRLDPNDSAVWFGVTEGTSDSSMLLTLSQDAIATLVNDDPIEGVFRAPLFSTGQCGQDNGAGQFECVAMGDDLGNGGLADMCWHVDGMVQSDTTMMPPVDMPALVPEEGDCAPALP